MKYNHEFIGQTYFSDIRNISLLTPEEESALVKKLKKSNGEYLEYRNKLVEGNLRLVIDIAKRFVGRGLEFIDLIQEGNLGLIKAVEHFDYREGVKFPTYATHWIRAYIQRSIKQKSRTIRIPDHLFDEMLKFNYLKTQIKQELGRKPTRKELADKLKLDVEKVNLLFIISKQMQLENLYVTYGDEEVHEFIDTNARPPDEIFEEYQLRVKVREFCEFLKEREKRVLFLRYGIGNKNEKGLKLREVGDKMHLCRERVRQLQARAIRKLQTTARKKVLEDCF